jgi:hypothetical protein
MTRTSDRSRFASPIELFRLLKTVWAKDTAGGTTDWSPDNPAKNHCSVTALIVQDYFGGEILNTKTAGGTHFYNAIDGKRWDLTVSQFAEPICFEDNPSTREAAMADASNEKYRKLAERVRRGSL